MTVLTDDEKAKGRCIFLAGNPEISARILAITDQEAKALGMSVEELRISETMKELGKYAHAHNQDPVELFWSCIYDTAAEVNDRIATRNQAIARAIGTD